MHYRDFAAGLLTEAIEVSGNDLAAYVMVVSEEFDRLPKFDKNEAFRWKKMVEHSKKFMPRIMSKVTIEVTEEDPYKTIQELMYDIVVNKRMKVFKTTAGSHPGIADAENDAFRAEHDFIGHFSPNAKEFQQFLKKNNIDTTKDVKKKLKDFKPAHNSFTVRGEMSAYLTNTKIVPPDVIPALFTEVVGQISVYFVSNDFTENKVGLIKGVDYQKIGRFTDQRLADRAAKYKAMLDDPDVKKIKLKSGRTVDKSKIKWGLLSRGELLSRRKKADK